MVSDLYNTIRYALYTETKVCCYHNGLRSQLINGNGSMAMKIKVAFGHNYNGYITNQMEM